MDVLYILKNDPDATVETFINEQQKSHKVTVVDLRTDKDYDTLVDRIASSDKVISW